MMHIIIIVALNLILYIRTMKYLLIADDLQHYISRSKWLRFKNIRKPIDFISWLRQHLYGGFTFGANVSIEHLFTIVLHTTISLLIYLALGKSDISFWAALLYSVNPLNNQTSIWLNGRRYAINIILVLTMILVSGLKYSWLYVASLYAITMLFQVTAIFSPVLFLYMYPLISLAVPLFVFFMRREILGKIKNRYEKIKDEDRIKLTPKRITIVIKNYGHYFFKMPFPGLCAMTYSRLHFWGQTKEGNTDAYSFNLDFLKGLLSIGASILGLWFFINNADYKLVCMWAFMCLSLLQWCGILPIVQDLADRYANVPNVFAMFFLSYFVHQWASEYTYIILAGLVGFYIPLLLNVMRMYRSEGSRWEYQRHWFPNLPAPLKFEAEYLIHDERNPLKAWVLIQEYLKYGGKDFTILFQAAKCHQMVMKLDEARRFIKEASENYNVNKEEIQAAMVKEFLKGCTLPKQPNPQKYRR